MGETDRDSADKLRSLPQIDRLSHALNPATPHWLRVEGARAAVAAAAERIAAGSPAPSFEELVAGAEQVVREHTRKRLSPLINATGVLLHTNLGRAPLSRDALEAIDAVSSGYSNLEYDLARGARGSRYEHSAALLASITGAEAGLVVNNNAGAVLLTLRALARGKEAIISRGELIEIGGEFRIPEIMAESGAVLREVGTTNRTHLKDYVRAIGPETGVILKVHPSNYEVTGFTASVGGEELAALAHELGLPFVHDVGSGLISHSVAGGSTPAWLAKEPSVTQAIAEGADLVTFSGDKLLGGPQAGLIVGSSRWMAELRKSSLLRTLRTDKTTLAALDSTLHAYRAGDEASLPFWRMALAPIDKLQARSEWIAGGIDGAGVVEGFSTTGGGSAPGSRIPTPVIRVAPSGRAAKSIVEGLLRSDPPVVARIEEGAVEINLRTVEPERDPEVRKALEELLG